MRGLQKFRIFDSSNSGFLASLVSAAFASLTRRPVGPRSAPAVGCAAQNEAVVRRVALCGLCYILSMVTNTREFVSEAERTMVDTIRPWIGSSLKVRGAELRAFIARGVDDPNSQLDSHVSDCGLFGLAVWHAAGVDHELLSDPYVTGAAITWLLQIGHDLQAIRYPKREGPPRPGALMHYKTNGHNDDHIEFCLSVARITSHAWQSDHAGGGRSDCGIGAGTSDILWNSGRPLQAYYDANALLDRASQRPL